MRYSVLKKLQDYPFDANIAPPNPVALVLPRRFHLSHAVPKTQHDPAAL
jgi:hypothetical protein